MPPVSADQLLPDQSAIIANITLPALADRLYDMGITPGCSLQLLLCAPCKDPLIFCTSACIIALRRKDYRHILLCP